MNPVQKAVRDALIRAAVVAERQAATKPDRPRWRNGDPKRQLPDGGWVTDYRAVLEEKHDRERMQFDETYARTVYRDLGGGDEALGARRFAEAIAADYADENAERIARS